MRTSEAPANVAPARRQPGTAGRESGIAMMYILMVTGLMAVITTTVMPLVAADLSTGIRQLQAVRAFNVAEAGVHHAIASLQGANPSTYPGATIAITDGGTTLGTAAVTVGCLDGTALPCAGTYSLFRRIVSVGTLPEGGPSRTIVAVVDGIQQYAICSVSSLDISPNITIYGDVGSDGSINLQGGVADYSRIRNDPPPPYTNNGYYSGSARAVSTVTCSQGCATQVAGTTSPSLPSPVCPTITIPPFSPGSDDQTVTPAGWTMDATTGYDWARIRVEDAGDATGCTGPTPFSDLRIQTGAAGTTTIINIEELDMRRCSRLILLGEGNVELRVEEEFKVGELARFGVLPTDTLASPAPVPSGRLVVYAGSNPDPGEAEVEFDGSSIASGTFIVSGEFEWEDPPPVVGQAGYFYGSVRANSVDLDDGNLVFTYDPTSRIELSFMRLRSWKDQ